MALPGKSGEVDHLVQMNDSNARVHQLLDFIGMGNGGLLAAAVHIENVWSGRAKVCGFVGQPFVTMTGL